MQPSVERNIDEKDKRWRAKKKEKKKMEKLSFKDLRISPQPSSSS